MENIPPIPHPEPAHNDPTACSTESPGSSLRSLPLLQQPTQSDCSATQNSIGSSSDFNVRQIARTENRLPPIASTAELSQPNSSTSGGSHPVLSGHDIADPPTELTPRDHWVPADAVFEADHVPAYSNNSTVPEAANNNQVSETTENNDATDESSPHMAFEDPTAGLINEGSSEPSPSTSSSKVSNSTVPSYGEISDIEPPDEETYRLRQIEDPRGINWEVLDLPKTSRARLYQYYICRVRKLRILCNQGNNMTDLPVHSEEDFALLRTLTRTNWGSRWWTIMIDDLVCPECVSLLKSRRRDPKSKCRKTWLKIMSKIRRVCLCRDNSHDFVCHHTGTDMNKVTRFFHTLGEKNASRMVNIELDSDPRFPVNIDVLASAAYNATRYFKDAQRISVKFHFNGTDPIEREHIEGVVCSLAKLEAMLPWAHKLHVAGFEDHEEYQSAWIKKSRARKWWMR